MRALRYLLNWQTPCGLQRAWRHNLAGCRIPQDFAEFCGVFGKAAGFAALTDHVARAVHHADGVATALDQVLRHPAKAALQGRTCPPNWFCCCAVPAIKSPGSVKPWQQSYVPSIAAPSRMHRQLIESRHHATCGSSRSPCNNKRLHFVPPFPHHLQRDINDDQKTDIGDPAMLVQKARDERGGKTHHRD